MQHEVSAVAMSSPAASAFEHDLLAYRRAALWQRVRGLSPSVEAVQMPGLALKAMLLAGWWQDLDAARHILGRYTPPKLDALSHFALSYTALCLGDLPRFQDLQRSLPPTQPRWMRHWLEIERLGRSLQARKQLQAANALLAQHRKAAPPDYLLVALLQSATHPLADKSALAHWLSTLPPAARQASPLVGALEICLGQPSERRAAPLAEMHPAVLYWHAHRLKKEGAVLDALPAFDQLARTGFIDLVGLRSWLTLSISMPQGLAAHGERAQFAINLVPDSLPIQGTVAGYAMISAWNRGDYQQAHAIVQRFHPYLKLPKTDLVRNTQIFFAYAGKLCLHWQAHPQLYQRPTGPSHPAPLPALVAVGESHSMTLANLYFPWQVGTVKGLTAFVMGAKMHHLGDTAAHYQGECVRLHLEGLKTKPVHLLMTIGEIDCRPDEGLWPLHRKTGQPLDALIERTVSGYIDFLQRTLVGHQLASITVQGIPAPGYAFEEDKDPGDIPGFVAMIRAVNDCLRAKSLAAGFNFLDVHAATVGADGRGNGRWHLDGYHLSPAFYRQAQDWLRLPN